MSNGIEVNVASGKQPSAMDKMADRAGQIHNEISNIKETVDMFMDRTLGTQTENPAVPEPKEVPLGSADNLLKQMDEILVLLNEFSARVGNLNRIG